MYPRVTYPLTSVDGLLHNPLNPFKARTHVWTRSNRGDRIRQRSRFIRVCKVAILYCIPPFLISIFPELYAVR